MTYEDAVNALVEDGLVEKSNAALVITVLSSPSIDINYPAWANALYQAGLLDEDNIDAVINVMEKTGIAEAKDDPAPFDDALENAGIL